MMGMENNVYGELLLGLQLENQKILLTSLQEDGTLEKHIYEPGREEEAVEALAQQAAFEKKVCILGFEQEQKRAQGSEPYRTKENGQDDRPDCAKNTCHGSGTDDAKDAGQNGKKWIAEPFCRENRMLIFGGGHVSLALAEFAARTGFSVTVTDDRPAFANKLRFPTAKEVLCMDFEAAIEKLGVNSSDFAVLLTRGHRHDGVCLKALVKQPQTAYLGMIGSRKRVREFKDTLEEEGISRAWLDWIHTPVGLDIGAVTPEEIAVAILAETIQVKRKPETEGGRKVSQSDIDMEVIHDLAEPDEKFADQKKAVITILGTKGSTPRKAGAKMIVYETGLIQGTIGGGCAEANLMQHAREVIRDGIYQIRHVDMTGKAAEEEGMVCGGVMQVLIERDDF